MLYATSSVSTISHEQHYVYNITVAAAQVEPREAPSCSAGEALGDLLSADRPRLPPAWEGSRRVTTLPERNLFAIMAAWRGMDDGRLSFLIRIASTGRPSRTNRSASMRPACAMDRSPCKPIRACGWSGGSRRIGGMSAALTTSLLPPCRGPMTRPGLLSWPGWERPAIRSWRPACMAIMGGGGLEHPLWCLIERSLEILA